MEHDELFLETLDDLESRVHPAPSEYEVLGAALLLRKLLVDSPGLVHLVNQQPNRRLKVRFPIADTRPIWEIAGGPRPEFWSIEDGLDPETTPMPGDAQEATLAQLLKTVVMIAGGQEITVKDVIKHAAHVAGAVHAGKPGSDEEEALAEAAKELNIGGYPVGTRMLQAIGRVTLNGLAELRTQIREELESPESAA